MALPKRTADTMSDAIALSSPNGRMSKRAKEAAVRRLAKALFGDGLDRVSLQGGLTPQPSERKRLLAQAATLRELAARGMSAKRFTKEADRLEADAALLCESPEECIYEAKNRGGSSSASAPADAWCRTHGFDCPNVR